VLEELKEAGAKLVQIDEPTLVLDLDAASLKHSRRHTLFLVLALV